MIILTDEEVAQMREALKDATEAIKYHNEDDTIGSRGCCDVLSYESHRATCTASIAFAILDAAPTVEQVAWIFPNDLQNLLEMETSKEVYSVEVSGPEGRSVPLYARTEGK
jgi:hypothetical protein